MLFDLHMHSRYSVDALTKPETIVKICKKNSWGFSLTDHNNMNAYTKGKIKEIAKKEKVLCIPGEEIKVLSGKNASLNGKIKENGNRKQKCVGEVIAYFLEKEIAPCSFEEILDEVKKQDALLSCPHPFDWPRKNFKDFEKKMKYFSCMEVFNARAYYMGLNNKSLDFFETKAKGKLAPLGVSDAHTPEEIGNGLTEINATTLEGIRKEIKKKKTEAVPMYKANLKHHLQTQLARRNWIKAR
jgi:predicted metal-dependent phosphoesterase TrpH